MNKAIRFTAGTLTLTGGSARWLSAAGHPGYSADTGARVLARMTEAGADPTDLKSVSEWTFQTVYFNR